LKSKREERALKQSRLDREGENVLKFRVDDGWNVRASWSGRVKSLLVEVGVSAKPLGFSTSGAGKIGGEGPQMMAPGENGSGIKRWTGNVGVSIAYST